MQNQQKKTTWFYYNKNGEKRGPFTQRQLKNLASQGVVTPETRIENAEGQSCLAKKATNLHFASTEESALDSENVTVEYVEQQPLYRRVKKSVPDKTEEDLVLHKGNIIGGVVTVAILLGIIALIYMAPQRTPSGIVYLEGTVTLDGNLISGVSVILHPRNGEGTAAGGMTDARGIFTVTTHPAPAGSGAMAGEYDVTFSKVEVEVRDIPMMPAPAPAPSAARHTQAPPQRTYIIPQRYGRPSTSGLEPITVEANERNRFTFVLTSSD